MTCNPTTMQRQIHRRQLFQNVAGGMGPFALATMLSDSTSAAPQVVSPLAAKKPHFKARAKNIIFLHMVGGPSQLDLFEHKPELVKNNGKQVPKRFIEGQRFAFIRGVPKLMGTPFKFKKHGQSGIEFSDLLPNLGSVADEVCVCKTLESELINHAPAQLFMQTGFGRFGRPSVGSWVSYGLGSENADLPAFVVLITGGKAGAGNSLWGSGFLPTVYQGIEFRKSGDPVLFLSNPAGVTTDDRRRLVDDIKDLNGVQLANVGDPEIATRISQYEMAYRMQMSVPELTDLKKEDQKTLASYGAKPGKPSFANNCLLARRLVERGVRFVQLYDSGWDHHSNIKGGLTRKCKEVDQPIAALIKDLKARGMLDDTLVVWTAEFGRTPLMQGSNGRDHHKDAFCALVAGGGVKPGYVHGATDELGYYATENRMPVHDFHATLLHLLGIDHERLTFKFQGRPFRLTDVHGHVHEEMLA
ncbi:MAG: DUF1501 domain-containing protein [Pirellulales bacterium]|nr:DUF1501 domain-containing protein [Pirellulales bacterium]